MPPLIVLTNDDGVESFGIHAAADALRALGDLLVVAPNRQMTAMGRAMPSEMTGRLEKRAYDLPGGALDAWAVDGSPAQAVQFAVLELAPHLFQRPVDLVVSGINFGENIGNGITISGTLGAALEAASFGIRALAASLETHHSLHMQNSPAIDFSTAAYFTRFFAEKLLNASDLPQDVHLLKLDVPQSATPNTPWRVGHQSPERFYSHRARPRQAFDQPGKIEIVTRHNHQWSSQESDIFILSERREVSLVPLSLEMTSRTALHQVASWLSAT